MSAILVDIGNSSTKLGIIDGVEGEFDPDRLIRINSDLSGEAVERFHSMLSETPPTHCYISSVNASHHRVFVKLVKAALPGVVCHALTAADVPLKSNVESRKQLGIDRLLAAYAATSIFDQTENSEPVIVIEAGTAVTIDLVDSRRIFKGGVIFPGAETSLRALHGSTGELPDLSRRWKEAHLEKVIGDSTESAMLSGVLSAQACAITGIVDRVATILDASPVVFASGGGIQPIRQLLPNHCNYVDHLVLRGIARVVRSMQTPDIVE